MKRILGLLAFSSATFLAACGGGGGGGITPTPIQTLQPTPTVTPTQTPQARTVSWRVVGAMNGENTTTAQATRRRMTTSGATPVPVMAMLCDGATGPFANASGSCNANYDNNPAVIPVEDTPSPSPGVSPSPAPTPASVTTTLAGVSFSTIPAGSQYLGVSYANAAYAISNPPQTGLYSINVAYPDGTTGSIPLAVYPIFQTGCASTVSVGYDFENNVTTAGSTNADLWWDCANGVLHIPGGATFLPLSTPLASVLTTAWKNDFTAYDGSNPTPLTNIIVLKTRDGSIVKLFPYVGAYSHGSQTYLLMGGFLKTTPPTEFTY